MTECGKKNSTSFTLTVKSHCRPRAVAGGSSRQGSGVRTLVSALSSSRVPTYKIDCSG